MHIILEIRFRGALGQLGRRHAVDAPGMKIPIFWPDIRQRAILSDSSSADVLDWGCPALISNHDRNGDTNGYEWFGRELWPTFTK